jgi:hypothetical protein
MSLLATPNYSATKYYDFNVEMPGAGGVNLNDLEYDLEPNQSPKMLNMMIRDGSLSKRYGQQGWISFQTEENDDKQIYSIGYFNDDVFIGVDDGIYKCNVTNKEWEISYSSQAEIMNGHFINFNRNFYYWNGNTFLVYEDGNWNNVEYYVPDVVINRKPDGTYSDPIDNYNRIGTGFKNTFHGDGTSTVYVLTDKDLDSTMPIVEVDGQSVTDFTFDATKGTVTFKTAPSKGTNNVEIVAYKTNTEYFWSVANFKYCSTYGGTNNSRLFVGGCGDGCVYYSDTADITYFPDNNSFVIGADETDVTGLAEQYDVLMIFKPNEIYSLEYYVDDEGLGAFKSKLVNAKIGCDAPNTIQLVNNQLVWLSTKEGVCTLVSTNIEDERNVRQISRNINGSYRANGLMNEENLKDCQSVDFDNKYFITCPSGKAYVWDYLLTPYANTGKLDADAKRLAWFIFDNFNAEHFLKVDNELYYTKGSTLRKLTDDFNDFGEPINAYYQTPYFQFDAVAYLKTVKNIYVQTRADTATVIHMTYFTEEDPNGEIEPEAIRVYDRLWKNFSWSTFGWQVTNIANTFRRKCSLKKIQMCSVLFENNELDRDISISHLTFQYTVVKNIK